MKQILVAALTDTHLREDNLDVNISAFRQALEYCVKNKLERLFHLGDIINSRKSQSLAILKTFELILDMCSENGVKLVTIPGNHEKTSYQFKDSFLDPFKHHPAFELIDDYNCIEIEECAIHLLPFFSDEVYSLKLAQITPIHTVRNILLTHIGVEGATMNNGMSVGGIRKSEFGVFEQIYVGHYHDKQVFDKFNYVGASIQHNYGETPDKGLTVIYDDLSFETVELEFPRYLKIDVDIDKLTPKEVELLRKEKVTSNDFLRVVLHGSEAKLKAFNKQVFLESGIGVEQKVEKIEKQELEERVEPFTQSNIFEEFDIFCERGKLSDKQRGLQYLKKSLNIAQHVPSKIA